MKKQDLKEAIKSVLLEEGYVPDGEKVCHALGNETTPEKLVEKFKQYVHKYFGNVKLKPLGDRDNLKKGEACFVLGYHGRHPTPYANIKLIDALKFLSELDKYDNWKDAISFVLWDNEKHFKGEFGKDSCSKRVYTNITFYNKPYKDNGTWDGGWILSFDTRGNTKF